MGIGRNPFVAKAEAAEAKAQQATDVGSEVRVFLEAARLWDRAAAREEGKRRAELEARAEAAREHADAATQQPPPSPAAVSTQLKVLRGGVEG